MSNDAILQSICESPISGYCASCVVSTWACRGAQKNQEDCRETLHDRWFAVSGFVSLTIIFIKNNVLAKLCFLGMGNASNAAWTTCLYLLGKPTCLALFIFPVISAQGEM